MKNPHLHLVPIGHSPLDVRKHLRYRRRTLQWARESEAHQLQLKRMCREDPLFWVSTFGFTYDPRLPMKVVPFIPYEYQVETINDTLDLMLSPEGGDLLLEKSRDMGASWILMYCGTYLLQFVDNSSGLFGSRKEEYVDKSGDHKALFWKIDFILKHQPTWLTPNLDRRKLHFENLDNGATIDGESTNSDFGRGDRRTYVGLDEFASVDNGDEVLAATGAVTNTRIFNSTPKGMSNSFGRKAHDGSCKKITLHWSRHPVKAAGLYRDEAGKLRSPWYDKECARASSPAEIAQELDIDYLGSEYQFFDQDRLRSYEDAYCRPPLLKGSLVKEPDGRVRFVRSDDGPLHLWRPLGTGGRPDGRRFAVACDISMGTGASLSTATLVDVDLGEKIGAVAVANLRPDEFAELVVEICHWLNHAFLGWESNGPGRAFGSKVLELGYFNIYYRRNEDRVDKKRSQIPGWHSSPDTKLQLFERYREALARRLEDKGGFANPCRLAIDECRYYIVRTNGTIAHSGSEYNIDPTGARSNHGDRAVADALAWHLTGRAPDSPYRAASRVAQPDSFMYRREQRQAAARRKAQPAW